jgi:hypothetical protein
MEHIKYARLSIEDSSGLGSNSLLSSPFSAEKPPTRHRLIGFVFSKTTLISYCALSTTVIVFLMAAVLGQLRMDMSCRYWGQNRKSFQGVLGSDPSYMSLDHKYDSLWEDLGSTGLVIKLPDSNYGGQPRHASISMYASFYRRCRGGLASFHELKHAQVPSTSLSILSATRTSASP